MDNVFKKTQYGYEAEIELETWCDFFDEDFKVTIEIGGDSTVEAIEKKHIVSLNEVIEHQEEILETLLTELLKRYPKVREDYKDCYDGEDIEDYLPAIEDIEEISDFLDIVGPGTIHIMDVDLNGRCCIGYDFSCTWDEEHGIGFMTYNHKVYSFGGADESFLTWVARNTIKKAQSESI